jgi:hypothetical protein
MLQSALWHLLASPLTTPLVLGWPRVRLSLRLVSLTFLPADPISDGKLACGSRGSTVVVVEVQIDPVLWLDARGATLGLVFTSEGEGGDFERG